MAYNLKIPALQAKLKSMHSKMLDEDDYNELLMLDNLVDAINMIKQRFPMLVNLNENMHRKDVEVELSNIFLFDIKKIYTFLDKNEKNYCDMFLSKFSMISDENVDIAFWKKLYETSKNNRNLKELVGTEIDVMNLLWIFRSKKFFDYSSDEIKEILIPIYYRLSPKEINRLLDVDYNEFFSEINNTQYGDIIQNETNIYYDFGEYQYKKCIHIFRESSFDISIVIAYFYLLEFEIRNIINIIESIRYKSDKRELQKRIII